MALFYPTIYRRRITDVTAEDLRRLGARAVLLDVDNTLTTYGSQELSPAIRSWLQTMQDAGIALTVVSNAFDSRVAPFAKKIGLRHIALSCKPSPIGFWRAVRRLGLSRRECAAVGDQVFTDVLGANLGGIRCVLLKPIYTENEKPFLRLRRQWEKPIRRRGEELSK